MIHYSPSVRISISLLLVATAFAPALAGRRVGWRYDGSGHFPNTDPPRNWSKEENVVWKTELPGRSLASPVVVGERIFVTSEPADIVCLSTEDGRVLWQHTNQYVDVFGPEKGGHIERNLELARYLRKEIDTLNRERNELRKSSEARAGDGESTEFQQLEEQIAKLRKQVEQLTVYPPMPGGDTANTGSTPVTDGKNVFVVFGTGIVASYTINGKRNWIEFVEAPRDHSASPALIGGKLIVHYQNLNALDVTTGKTVWQTPTGARHGSPVVGRVGDTSVVVTPGGAIVRVDDGEILAKNQFRLGHCSPIVHEGVVYAMQDGAIKAVKLPHMKSEEVELAAWEADGSRTSRLASPIYHDGLLYGVTDKGVLEVTEAKSGDRVYRKRLGFDGGRVDPSLCLAGGKIYVSNNRGTTVVFRPGRQFQEISRNDLEEFKSSLAFSGRRMYVRTRKHLYCIE